MTISKTMSSVIEETFTKNPEVDIVSERLKCTEKEVMETFTAMGDLGTATIETLSGIQIAVGVLTENVQTISDKMKDFYIEFEGEREKRRNLGAIVSTQTIQNPADPEIIRKYYNREPITLERIREKIDRDLKRLQRK